MAPQTIPGPLVFSALSSTAHREMFSGLPVFLDMLDWHILFDDFNRVTLDATNDWTVISDAGCTAALVADTQFGIVQFTSDSGDNEGSSIQGNEVFKLVSGKKLIFECRCAMADADDGDIAIGLAENFATNPEAMIAGSGVWFQVNEGAGSIFAKAGAAGASSEDTGVDFANGGYRRLGFVYDGSNTVDFYVDREKKVSMNFASMPTTELTPCAYYINGATDTDNFLIDYIFVAEER